MTKEVEANRNYNYWGEVHQVYKGIIGVCVECDAGFSSDVYTGDTCSCGGDIDWMEEEIDW